VEIRSATPKDLAQLQALHQERIVLLRQSDPRCDFPVEKVAAWLENTDCTLYVGEQNGEIVGYVVGWVNHSPFGILPPDTGLISELTLDAHKYHGGLGRTLFTTLCEWFSDQDIKQVIVIVPRYHAVEQAFWRALGASETRTQPIEGVQTTVFTPLWVDL
jgi:ribosomal protein S18 acetylase RimI-like enzyme